MGLLESVSWTLLLFSMSTALSLLQAGVTPHFDDYNAASSAPLPPPTPSPCHNDPFKVAFLSSKSSNSFPLKGNAQIPPVAWKLRYNLSDLPLDPPAPVIHSAPLQLSPLQPHQVTCCVWNRPRTPCLGGSTFTVPLSSHYSPRYNWVVHSLTISLSPMSRFLSPFPKLAIENCSHTPQSPSRSPLLCLFFFTDACHPLAFDIFDYCFSSYWYLNSMRGGTLSSCSFPRVRIIGIEYIWHINKLISKYLRGLMTSSRLF